MAGRLFDIVICQPTHLVGLGQRCANQSATLDVPVSLCQLGRTPASIVACPASSHRPVRALRRSRDWPDGMPLDRSGGVMSCHEGQRRGSIEDHVPTGGLNRRRSRAEVRATRRRRDWDNLTRLGWNRLRKDLEVRSWRFRGRPRRSRSHRKWWMIGSPGVQVFQILVRTSPICDVALRPRSRVRGVHRTPLKSRLRRAARQRR